MGVLAQVMRLFRKAAPPLQSVDSRGGWMPLIREPFTGAWQHNMELRADHQVRFFAVFACITLIAADIAKLPARLMAIDSDGIWTETASPSFSPVLRKPNRYQNWIQFIQQWVISMLMNGNCYVLKQRDARGIVTAMYVLEPTRVTPLVTTEGDVYYRLSRDDLSGVPIDVVVAASEIIHDRMNTLFHPLVGISPLFACALATAHGLHIQKGQSKFFANAARPSGVLTAPEHIADDTAARVKQYWEENYSGEGNEGKIAVLGDGLKYEPMTMTAVDAQVIDQLKISAEQICSVFHVPGYMIQVGPLPTYQHVGPLTQQYFSQCLQSRIESIESCLNEGLSLPSQYQVELDIDPLLRMDMETRYRAYGEAIKSAVLAQNEARKKENLKPVKGGDTPYMQQQNFSLAALNRRDSRDDPFATDKPPPAPQPPKDASTPSDAAAKEFIATTLRGFESVSSELDQILAADGVMADE